MRGSCRVAALKAPFTSAWTSRPVRRSARVRTKTPSTMDLEREGVGHTQLPHLAAAPDQHEPAVAALEPHGGLAVSLVDTETRRAVARRGTALGEQFRREGAGVDIEVDAGEVGPEPGPLGSFRRRPGERVPFARGPRSGLVAPGQPEEAGEDHDRAEDHPGGEGVFSKTMRIPAETRRTGQKETASIQKPSGSPRVVATRKKPPSPARKRPSATRPQSVRGRGASVSASRWLGDMEVSPSLTLAYATSPRAVPSLTDAHRRPPNPGAPVGFLGLQEASRSSIRVR